MGVAPPIRRARLAGLALGLVLACGCGDGDGGSGGTAPPAVPPAGPGSPAPPAMRVDGVLSPVRSDGDLPALGALVLQGGAVVAEGVVGVRKSGDATAATVDDPWSLGTDAQAMTATLAALVVEDGKLAWSSTLGAVLPDVQMHASYKDVTLEALLAHRGGAPVALPASVEQSLRASGEPRALREAAVRSLLGSAPETPPNTAYHLSDAGYLMAALVLERASGKSWEELLRTRLLDPLGMTGCEYGATTPPSNADPWGHRAIDGTMIPVAPGSAGEPAPALGPAGAIRCPLRSWAKFCALHLAGARLEKTPIVSPTSFAKLQTPQDGIYALGWNSVSRPWAGSLPALNQSSRAGIDHALVWVVPEKNTVLLVVTNRGDDRAFRATEEALGDLVQRFVPKE